MVYRWFEVYKYKSESLQIVGIEMSVALLVVGIIVVIVNLCKDAKEDAECRRHAQQIGLDFYASSTGLRNTKTGEKYYK